MRSQCPNAVLIGTGIVAVVGAVLTWVLCPGQPQHQGKPLSYWVAESTNPNTNRQEVARHALRQIGPKAVPFLLWKARNESSPVKKFYREAWFRLPGQVQRCWRQPQSEDDIINGISHALHLLGPSSGPALMKALEDQNSAVRLAAAGSFPYDDNSQASVLWLMKVLGTPDYEPKQAAAGMLGMMGTNAARAVPALLHVIEHDEFAYVRETAARSVARLAGPAMASAVPKLKECLNDSVASVRVWSAIALWRINPDTHVVPVLVADLKTASAEDGTCHAVIQILGEAGALAQAAVPAIRAKMLAYNPERALPEGAGALIQAAREALLRIDPGAIPEFDVPVP